MTTIDRVPEWKGRRSRVAPISGSRAARTWEQDPGYLSHRERATPWTVVDSNMDGVLNEQYYNKSQMKFGLPANLPASRYMASPQFADLNRRVHTQTLQPGYTTRNQNIEPINGNLGISATPQLQPLVAEYTGRHDTELMTRLDPLTADAQVSDMLAASGGSGRPATGQPRVRLADVYDPRFTGYGDPYRAYEDATTGQVRYYYGDVDAHKTPNYIVRSLIDHMDFTQGYGPLHSEYPDAAESLGDIGSCARPWADIGDLRGKVEEQYLADDIAFRTSMMESLMRKRNSEAWQRRVAPLSQSAHTSGFRCGPR